MTDDVLKVTGEFLPDPNMCRFEVNRPVLEEWSVLFKDAESSMGSPLIDALFAIEGITRVKVSGSNITLTKNVETPWPELAKAILPAIKEPLLSGTPPIAEAVLEVVRAQPSEDVTEQVQEVLEEYINPALASHGGWVKLVKVEDSNVYIEMGGGCKGCAASRMTMKHGVESAIREACPQVREVIDVTDHASGTNPYYTAPPAS